MTLRNGVTGTSQASLTIGDGSSTKAAIVEILSGSSVAWRDVTAQRKGVLRVSGFGSLLNASAIGSSESPTIAVNGAGTELTVSERGRVQGSWLHVSNSGKLVVMGNDSRLQLTGGMIVGAAAAPEFGFSDPAVLQVDAGAVVTSAGTLRVTSGGRVTLNGGTVSALATEVDTLGMLTGRGGIAGPLSVRDGGSILAVGGALKTGSVSFLQGSRFEAQLKGTAGSSQYSQLDVSGTITLNGASLEVSESFTSQPGDRFQIIRNDGTDPIIGTFTALGEGALLILDGVSYTITYQGGDGNDADAHWRILGGLLRFGHPREMARVCRDYNRPLFQTTRPITSTSPGASSIGR